MRRAVGITERAGGEGLIDDPPRLCASKKSDFAVGARVIELSPERTHLGSLFVLGNWISS